jgi:hypothetical protein
MSIAFLIGAGVAVLVVGFGCLLVYVAYKIIHSLMNSQTGNTDDNDSDNNQLVEQPNASELSRSLEVKFDINSKLLREIESQTKEALIEQRKNKENLNINKSGIEEIKSMLEEVKQNMGLKQADLFSKGYSTAFIEYLEQSDVPSKYTCPITKNLMRVPVTVDDGHTYEKSAIQLWFDSGHKFCPMNPDVPLNNPANVHENLLLKNVISKFVQEKFREFLNTFLSNQRDNEQLNPPLQEKEQDAKENDRNIPERGPGKN